jgi:putative addiction module CopG family antidote
MNAQIPENWGPFIRSQIESGRYASEAEVLEEALGLLKQREDSERPRAMEGIRLGLEDLRGGRTQPLAEAFADIRRELNLPLSS